MEIPKALRRHLSEIGKRGGANRWKGVSKAKRSAHGKAMIEARWRRNGNGK